MGGRWGLLSCVVDHILQVFNTDQIQNLKNCYATPKNSVPQRGLKVLRKKMPQRKASEMGGKTLFEGHQKRRIWEVHVTV